MISQRIQLSPKALTASHNPLHAGKIRFTLGAALRLVPDTRFRIWAAARAKCQAPGRDCGTGAGNTSPVLPSKQKRRGGTRCFLIENGSFDDDAARLRRRPESRCGCLH